MDSAQFMQGILESLGWAILHSFWQMALLWLAYQLLFAARRKDSPLLRHHAAVAAMTIGTVWFIATFIDQYHHYVAIEQYLALVPETQVEAMPAAASALSVTSILQAVKDFATAHIAWLSAIYLCMLALMGWRLLQGCLQVQTLRTEGLAPVTPDLQRQVVYLAQRLSIAFPVRIHLSRLVDVPATLGVLKPVILLPVASIAQLSPAQLESILLHELAHIRRMDYLVNLVVGLMETLLLHNPFAWWFARSIRREREWCCDDIVLAEQQDALEYASALLSLEQQRRLPAMALAMASNGQQGQLLQRIRRITRRPSAAMAQPHRLMALGLMVLLMFSMAWIGPSQSRAGAMDRSMDNIEITRMILEAAPRDLTRPEQKPRQLTSTYNRKITTERIFLDETIEERRETADAERLFTTQLPDKVYVNQAPPESFTFSYTQPAEEDLLFVFPGAPALPPAASGSIPEFPLQYLSAPEQHLAMEKEMEALRNQQQALEKMIRVDMEHEQALKAIARTKIKRQPGQQAPSAPRAGSPRVMLPQSTPGSPIERVFTVPSWDPQVWEELYRQRIPQEEASREKAARIKTREVVKVNRIKTKDGYTLRIVTGKESIDIRIAEDDIVVEKD